MASSSSFLRACTCIAMLIACLLHVNPSSWSPSLLHVRYCVWLGVPKCKLCQSLPPRMVNSLPKSITCARPDALDVAYSHILSTAYFVATWNADCERCQRSSLKQFSVPFAIPSYSSTPFSLSIPWISSSEIAPFLIRCLIPCSCTAKITLQLLSSSIRSITFIRYMPLYTRRNCLITRRE